MVLGVLIKFSKEGFLSEMLRVISSQEEYKYKNNEKLPLIRVIKITTFITSSADQDVVQLAPSHTAHVNFNCLNVYKKKSVTIFYFH